LLDYACAAKAQDEAEVVSNGVNLVIKRLSIESASQMPQPAAAARGGGSILAIVGDCFD
jgi:hypothetical protein